jgi:hypothetical protein
MNSPQPCILGIDPGLSGGIAFLSPFDGRMTAEDTPVAGSVIDAANMAERIRQFAPTQAVIELVGAMPGQGVTSMFTFGRAFGTAIGIVQTLQIPIEFVSPARWKKHFRLPSDKEAARRKAIELYPSSAGSFSRKKDHGRAEATLLARYGADLLLNIGRAA